MKNILVTYATRAGSTQAVAQTIGQVLSEMDARVDVIPIKSVRDVNGYDAVVIGSAIRGGTLLPETMQFVQAHRASLAHKPVAVFLVCITLAMPNGEAYRPHVAKWLEPVRALIMPVSEGLFAGALNASKLPLMPDGLAARGLSLISNTPEADYPNWEAIRSWARELQPLLTRAELEAMPKIMGQRRIAKGEWSAQRVMQMDLPRP